MSKPVRKSRNTETKDSLPWLVAQYLSSRSAVPNHERLYLYMLVAAQVTKVDGLDARVCFSRESTMRADLGWSQAELDDAIAVLENEPLVVPRDSEQTKWGDMRKGWVVLRWGESTPGGLQLGSQRAPIAAAALPPRDDLRVMLVEREREVLRQVEDAEALLSVSTSESPEYPTLAKQLSAVRQELNRVRCELAVSGAR